MADDKVSIPQNSEAKFRDDLRAYWQRVAWTPFSWLAGLIGRVFGGR